MTIKDSGERNAAIANAGESTFIEAGAGTGKTETIAKRIITSVCAPGSKISIENVVAITFTERAGAELRARIRKLLAAASEYDDNALIVQYLSKLDREKIAHSLVNIDAANIGTIHSFALRLLQRYPVQAGLPLSIEMLDTAEQASQMEIAANETVATFFETLIDRDLDALLDADIKTADLRKLLVSLQQAWLNIPSTAVSKLKFRDASAELQDLKASFESWYSTSHALFMARKLDKRSAELTEFFETAEKVRLILSSNSDEEIFGSALPGLIGELADSSNSSAEIKNFRSEVLGSATGLKSDISKTPLVHLRAHNLVVELVKSLEIGINTALDARARSGRLNFDDLLLLARKMVVDAANTKLVSAIQDELRLFVVDEFQDTDLTQWQLIRALTSEGNSASPIPGRLVIVGDPKQSIYRFRGADVETYESVRSEFENFESAQRRKLTVNFRSNEHVINFVNTVFAHDSLEMASIPYQPISVNEPGNLVGGNPAEYVRVIPESVFNDGESGVVADTCRKAIEEKWKIRVKNGDLREATFDDIAILIPTRTSQHDILESLFYQNVPVKTFDSAIVYDRPLVRGLIDAARVLAGSDNQLDLWFMLKSPLFGFSDDELLDYRLLGGIWDLRGFNPNAKYVESPVGSLLAKFISLGSKMESARPYEILGQVVSFSDAVRAHALLDRGYFEVDCLRLFLHHVKTWQSKSSGGLKHFVDWVDDYVDDESNERLSHPDSADPEHPAVEISTIHGVKGLEFPIVFVAGLGTIYRSRPKPVLVHPAGPNVEKTIEFKVGLVETAGHKQTHAKLEAEAELRERKRLLYVAATRAKDYLIFSNVTRERNDTYWARITAEAVKNACDQLSIGVADEFGELRDLEAINPVKVSVPVPPGFDDVIAEVVTRSERVWVLNPSSAGKASSTSESATAGLNFVSEDERTEQIFSDSVENEAEFGVAFHKAMELIVNDRSLFEKSQIPTYVERAMSETGYHSDFDEIVSRVGIAVEHELIRSVMPLEYVWTEIDVRGIISNPDSTENLIVGTADLVFKSGEILTVVDYKTGKSDDVAKQSFRAQLSLYKELFASATGITDIRCVILQVGSNGAQTFEL